MASTKTKEQITKNMKSVRSKDTALENKLYQALLRQGIHTFSRNEKSVIGKPDFVFFTRKLAVFCDGDFWHGYNWEIAKHEIKTNREFWINKIEKTMRRDEYVTRQLQADGWTVLRFWGNEIKKSADDCACRIAQQLRKIPRFPFKTIDLCAGIGGIRRGFEMTGHFKNVLSAEIDKQACKTYAHLYGEEPMNDLTDEKFKNAVESTPYDVLLAGFPCQTFSRVGLQEGFENAEKGQIFFHIAEIIQRTRPVVVFLENVDHLLTHDNGNTFETILDILVNKLGYHVLGVDKDQDGHLVYNAGSFIRNSRAFGVPQNRPRTYIIGFDTERFSQTQLSIIPSNLPTGSSKELYVDLNEVLDKDVEPRYYMATGYLNTLINHRKRQEAKGYGFGYRVVNETGIIHPIANTLLATGGSGKERNLIYDPREGIAGQMIQGKKTPLNNMGIRMMTPNEWGKLQGFVNYAFIDEDGNDCFSFPEDMPDNQRYKQLGNSVTIPVIEVMAQFVYDCIRKMRKLR